MRLLAVGVCTLFLATLANSCSNCCSSGGQSNCCTESCCSSGGQSNCCTESCCRSEGQSNCCIKSYCSSREQSNCCTKSCCSSGGQSNCCTESGCCKPESESLESTTGQPTRPTNSMTVTERPQPTSSQMVVNVSNNVHNENHINAHIDLSLSHVAYINVNSARGGSNGAAVTVHPTTSRPIHPESTPLTPTSIPPVAPTGYPPTQPGCCYVIQPCYLNICRQYSCGDHCTHPVFFKPVNPCPVRGCYSKSIWSRQYCGYESHESQCRHILHDCSLCDVNTFYHNYDSYSSCYGCFY